jgi:hypothetical protein
MITETAITVLDLDQVRDHFLALSDSGEVREIRILGHVPADGYGQPATLSGYFDAPDALDTALQGVAADTMEGVYITQNPVDPALLARACNHFKRKPKNTTTDADIIRFAHLTLDCDPVRKSGISSTDNELAAALALRDEIILFTTTELGWPAPVVSIMSGNGAQATWRINLIVDDDGRALVHAVLEALDVMFSTSTVAVDTTMGNPSRIVKLSGTFARKGDSLPHRPHRQAHSVFHPCTGTVTAEQLRTLAALAPAPELRTRSLNSPGPSSGGMPDYDVPALLAAAGIGYRERQKGYAAVYELDRCLSSDDHVDGAGIFQFLSGAVAYRCLHNRCFGVGWQDIKERLGIPPAGNGRATDARPPAPNGHRVSGQPSGNGNSAHATESGAATVRLVTPPIAAVPWPTLDDAAFYGLAGDVVGAIAPNTEGDPVAILLNFLVMFGSAVGPSPYARVGATRHHTNEFVVHVGETARARKGTAHNEVERIVAEADPDWKPRVMGGLSSGEGLIHAVRDPVSKPSKDGTMTLVVSGVADKRLLALEPEYSSVLQVASREGNTLSEVMRRSWDGNDLRTLTRNSPLVATAPHISLLGHITKQELLRELTETAQANGYANRHLFICVRRSKELPHRGALPDQGATALANRVRHALSAARQRGAVGRDDETNQVWEKVYSALTAERPGLIGAITARAEAHALRLSLLYALGDESGTMQRAHLEAALAIWQYAEDSVRFIFGDATGDPVADTILSTLRANGRLTQTQISELFGKNQRAGRIQAALAALLTGGKARTWQGEADNGRPPTYWEATR